MSHQINIHRSTQTGFLFLVDQSSSMRERMAGSEKTKAQFVADVLNKTFMDLITRCTRADGVRDFLDIGVIGYGGAGVNNALSGALSLHIMNPISAIEANPLRIEDRMRCVTDGAGKLVEQLVKCPVWLEPRAVGSAPMCEAIRWAGEELAVWCDTHPDSRPPAVLHVTNGTSADGDPAQLSEALRQFTTGRGNVQFFDLQVRVEAGNSNTLPTGSSTLSDQYAKLLSLMSSLVGTS